MKKLILFLCLLAGPFGAKTEGQTVSLVPHSSGYDWLVGFESAPAPPGSENLLYAFQKNGFIRVCHADGSIEASPFLDLSGQVLNDGERGLVGIAFHPDYPANGFFYVFYNQAGTGECTVSRFERSPADPLTADPASETVLLTWPHPKVNHVGGCMQFGPEGYLYIASGDGGGGGDPDGNGQNLGTFLGKLLRIDVDNGSPYAVPADNPFVDTVGAFPEIFAYGLRNPWRFGFDKLTGDLWIGDVGQNSREEINLLTTLEGGQNFGWSCREGTLPFNADECLAGVPLTEPIYDYENSLSSGNCSVTGGVVYRGSQFADLFGKYIFSDFCSGRIWALTLDGGEVESVVEMGDFSDNDLTVLNSSPNGEIYVSGLFSNKIFRIKSGDCTPVAWLPGPASISLDGGPVELEVYHTSFGFEYQWFWDGMEITGATSASLTTSEPGIYTVSVYSLENGCSNLSNAVEVTPATGTVGISGQPEACVSSSHYYGAEVFAGANYEWEISGGTLLDGQGSPQVLVMWGNAGTGLVSLLVTLPDGTGLTGETGVDILENDLSLSAVFPEGICPGANDGFIDLTVDGTGTPFSYFWNTNDTTEDIFNLPSGGYLVTVTNELGCQVSDGFFLSEVPGPSFDWVVEPQICTRPGSISGTGNSAPCGDFPLPDLAPLGGGTYNVTVTDCFGCLYLEEIEVPLLIDDVVVDVVLSPPSSGMSDGSIEVTPSGGTAPYSYLWSNGSTDNPLTNLPDGEYTVTVTDANGCELATTYDLMETVSGAGEVSLAQNMAVFPNPTDGVFTIEINLPQRGGKTAINLMDVDGKILGTLMEKKDLAIGRHQFVFDISPWPSGLYFLEIKTGEMVFYNKIVRY